MSSQRKGVPEGFHTVTPYLFVGGANEAISFYEEAFGATVLYRSADPESGRIRHAEIVVGDSPVMLTDEIPEISGPKTLGGSPVHVFLYVEDVDAVLDRAVAAGAKLIDSAKDYPSEGDRRGGVEDPFGLVWWIGTQFDAISREEMQANLDSASH